MCCSKNQVMIFMSCNINIINNLSLSFIIIVYMKLQVSIFANDSQQKKIKIYVHNNNIK